MLPRILRHPPRALATMVLAALPAIPARAQTATFRDLPGPAGIIPIGHTALLVLGLAVLGAVTVAARWWRRGAVTLGVAVPHALAASACIALGALGACADPVTSVPATSPRPAGAPMRDIITGTPGFAPPRAVPQIAVSDSALCAMRADGAAVQCWGPGAPAPHVPTMVGSHYRSFAASKANICAVRSDAVMECWGKIAGSGQTLELVSSDPAQPYVQAFAVDSAVCAQRYDGLVDCTTSRQRFQVGPYLSFSATSATPTIKAPLGSWCGAVSKTAPNTQELSCALFNATTFNSSVTYLNSPQPENMAMIDGGLYLVCGLNRVSITCRSTSAARTVSTLSSHGTRYVAVATDYDSTATQPERACALVDDGIIDCGSWTALEAPTLSTAPRFQSSDPNAPFVQFAMGHKFTCAIRTDSVVECVGTNAPATRSLAAPQTIAFSTPQPTSATVGDVFRVAATATSGLPVTITSRTRTVCVLAAGTVQMVASGQCTILASQPGAGDWQAAWQQSWTITVADPPLIQISNLVQTADGTRKPVTVTTYPAGLSYTVLYDGSRVVPTAPGTYLVEVIVTQPGYVGRSSAELIIHGSPSRLP